MNILLKKSVSVLTAVLILLTAVNSFSLPVSAEEPSLSMAASPVAVTLTVPTTTSKEASFIIKNDDEVPVEITSVAFPSSLGTNSSFEMNVKDNTPFTIAAGATRTIGYTVKEKDFTGPGSYELKAVISYGDSHEFTVRLPVTVKNISSGSGITVTSYTPITKRKYPGSTVDVTINISNPSQYEGARLSLTGGAFSLSDGALYVPVSSDKTSSLTFKTVASKGLTAGATTIDFVIDYIDNDDNDQSFSGSIPIYIYNLEEEDEKEKEDDETKASAPTPHIIIEQYSYGRNNITAGSTFSLYLKFYNTSLGIDVDNIVMTVSMPDEFTIANSSNTFYIYKLEASSSLEKSVAVMVKPTASSGSHPITVSFDYEYVEDNVRKSGSTTENIAIPVSQIDRFTAYLSDSPEWTLTVGEEFEYNVTIINKGKTEVGNITAELHGENIKQDGDSEYFGNLASGASDEISFSVTPTSGGDIKGEIVISYEDPSYSIRTITLPFYFPAEEYEPGEDFYDNEPSYDIPSEPNNSGFLGSIRPLYLIIGAVLLILIILAIIIRILKKKRTEDEDADF